MGEDEDRIEDEEYEEEEDLAEEPEPEEGEGAVLAEEDEPSQVTFFSKRRIGIIALISGVVFVLAIGLILLKILPFGKS